MTLRNSDKVRPNLTLDFRNSKKLDPRVTFTRASFAPASDPSSGSGVAGGQYNMFNVNVPRLTDQGLLIEESRTNLVPNSQVFQTGWTIEHFTPTDNAVVAPDGTTTAASLFETTVNDFHALYLAGVSQTDLCQSIFVKPAGRDNICVRFVISSGDWYTITFNLTGNGSITQEVASTGSTWTIRAKDIRPLPNGWYRIGVAATSGGSTSLMSVLGSDSPTPTLPPQWGFPRYTGDVTKGYYVWGAQVEANTFPTSYIPTNGAQVTRAADICTIINDELTSWYNTPEGTISSDAMTPWDLKTSRYVWYFTNPGRKEHNASGSFQWFDGGAGTTNGETYVGGTTSKQAYSYSNVVPGRPCLNGDLKDQFLANTSPSAHTRLSLGSNFGTNLFFNGYIQRFAYYPTCIPDSALQGATQRGDIRKL